MYSRLFFLCFTFYVSLVYADSFIQTTQNITQSTPKMVANNESTPSTYPLEVTHLEKSLWLHRPEALQPYQLSQALEAPRYVVQRHSYFVSKLTRLLGFGVAPYFHKIFFEPFERRKKPVVILTLKKQGIAPIKVTQPNKAPEVAVLQSPYNEIDDQAEDEASLNPEVNKNS